MMGTPDVIAPNLKPTTDAADAEWGELCERARHAKQAYELARKAVKHARRAQGAAEIAKEEAKQCRLELGRLFVEERKRYPASGPQAKGWSKFLGLVRIEPRTALRYMALAGYVEKISDTDGPVSETSVPNYHDAGIDTRPRKSEERDGDECSYCDGRGGYINDNANEVKCRRCDGTGSIERRDAQRAARKAAHAAAVAEREDDDEDIDLAGPTLHEILVDALVDTCEREFKEATAFLTKRASEFEVTGTEYQRLIKRLRTLADALETSALNGAN